MANLIKSPSSNFKRAKSFEKWAKPGHFSRTLAKGPKTTTWIWNLHADAHDFDSHTNSLEDVSRKIFRAHFGKLSLIFLLTPIKSHEV